MGQLSSTTKVVTFSSHTSTKLRSKMNPSICMRVPLNGLGYVNTILVAYTLKIISTQFGTWRRKTGLRRPITSKFPVVSERPEDEQWPETIDSRTLIRHPLSSWSTPMEINSIHQECQSIPHVSIRRWTVVESCPTLLALRARSGLRLGNRLCKIWGTIAAWAGFGLRAWVGDVAEMG